MQFLITLLEQPVLLIILPMYLLCFIGITYDFILRLCERRPFLEKTGGKGEMNMPGDTVWVPKSPTDPDDIIKEAAKIEYTDNNTITKYIFSTQIDPLKNNS